MIRSCSPSPSLQRVQNARNSALTAASVREVAASYTDNYVRMQQIQQLASTGISEGLEQYVGVVALCHVRYASNCLHEL